MRKQSIHKIYEQLSVVIGLNVQTCMHVIIIIIIIKRDIFFFGELLISTDAVWNVGYYDMSFSIY